MEDFTLSHLYEDPLTSWRRRRNPWGKWSISWGNLPQWLKRHPNSFNSSYDPMQRMQAERMNWIAAGQDPYRNADMTFRNPNGSPTYGIGNNFAPNVYTDSTIGGVQGNNGTTRPSNFGNNPLTQGLPDLWSNSGKNFWENMSWV